MENADSALCNHRLIAKEVSSSLKPLIYFRIFDPLYLGVCDILVKINQVFLGANLVTHLMH